MQYIYKLVFTGTTKFYIGQTENVETRFRTHIERLQRNRHHNVHLQRWFNKNLLTIASIEVLASFEDRTACDEFEEFCITETWDRNFNVSKKSGGGDLISYHPNREQFVEKCRENLLKRIAENPPKPKFGKDNPNYRHGKQTKEAIESALCSECGEVKVSYVGARCKECLKIIQSQTRKGENNKFYGKKHSQETRCKLSERMKDGYTTGKFEVVNAHKVVVDGIVFNSKTQCAKYLKTSVSTIQNRIENKKFSNYFIYQEDLHKNLPVYKAEVAI